MTAYSRSRNDYTFSSGSSTETLTNNSTVKIRNHSVVSSVTKNMVDVVTPGYRSLIRAGITINNDMTFLKTTIGAIPGSFGYTTGKSLDYVYIFDGYPEVYYANTFPLLHVDAPPLDEGGAKRRALARVDSTPHKMLEDVLEIRQTLNFLRNPLLSLFDLAKAFSKDVKTARRSTRIKRDEAIANVWLTYRFAVTPLVNSAYSIVDGLGRLNKPRPVIESARGKDKGKSDAEDTHAYGNTTCLRTVSSEVIIKAGIRYSVSNPASDWRYTFGLRDKDIPVALWQIVPFSFMIDRVSNISDMISGLVALADPNVSIINSWVTTKTEVYNTHSLLEVRNSYWRDFQASTGSKTRSVFSYRRTTWNPSILDTAPGFNPAGLVSSVTRISDLVALVVQTFRGA